MRALSHLSIRAQTSNYLNLFTKVRRNEDGGPHVAVLLRRLAGPAGAVLEERRALRGLLRGPALPLDA